MADIQQLATIITEAADKVAEDHGATNLEMLTAGSIFVAASLFANYARHPGLLEAAVAEHAKTVCAILREMKKDQLQKS